MLEAYEQHVKDRAKEGIDPKPLDAEQVSQLVELLKAGDNSNGPILMDLLENRIPAGVDDAAYVKAAFLADVAKEKAKCPILTRERATELLGTMLGGYNIEPLIELLESDAPIASIAAAGLSKTLLMFDAFHDVVEKSKSNKFAMDVLKSWAAAEWFTNKPKVPEKIENSNYLFY